jgi:hypothetical protein
MAVREVAFELECFEWADERLEVAGRWKGLGGRRLVRPVLTVELEAGRRKRIVALPGGHFGAAADSWRAAFAWPGDPAEITAAELEVGGNVVVDLPLPDRRRRRRKRGAATEGGGGDEALRAEVGALRAQIERLRSELAGRERENMRLQAQLDEASGADLDEVADAGSATVEIEQLSPAHEQELTAEIARIAAERDRTRAELVAEIERLEEERERVEGERERWRTEIDALREAFSDAAAEAEAARDSHRSELEGIEAQLRQERATVARLSAELAQRREPPPPATRSGRAGAAPPPTEALSAPPAGPEQGEGEDTPPPTEPLQLVVDAASVPGVLDPPGPMRAVARAGSQPDLETQAGGSGIPAWLRARRSDRPEDADSGDSGLGGPSAAAFAPERSEPAAAADAEKAPPGAALRALWERMEQMLVPNGHAETEQQDDEPAVPRPLRTATAARARAGATVAARRSTAELWGLRVLAVALVAVLLIAFLLIVTRIA